MKGKCIIVAVTNDLVTDQRVHKVCLFLHESGNSVLLVGRKRRKSLAMDVRVYKTKRLFLLFEKGPLFYAFFNLRLFFFLLFRKADVIVANDLDTLLACSKAAKWKRKKLVYDTHEYFTEVPELVNRPKVQKIWERIEGRIFPRLENISTVNQSIANLYEKKYGKKLKVIRNIPDPGKILRTKSRTDLGIPEDSFILIVQGAGINVDRGNEEITAAMEFLPDCILLIIGDGDVVDALKTNVKEKNLSDRVRFFPKMPYSEMMQFTLNADLGITLDKDTNINYKFSLPNKLFDFIHAGIPVFASDLPEVGAIIHQYEIGYITPTHDPKKIAEQIQSIISNQKDFQQKRSNTKVAARELTWEKECVELGKLYA